MARSGLQLVGGLPGVRKSRDAFPMPRSSRGSVRLFPGSVAVRARRFLAVAVRGSQTRAIVPRVLGCELGARSGAGSPNVTALVTSAAHGAAHQRVAGHLHPYRIDSRVRTIPGGRALDRSGSWGPRRRRSVNVGLSLRADGSVDARRIAARQSRRSIRGRPRQDWASGGALHRCSARAITYLDPV